MIGRLPGTATPFGRTDGVVAILFVVVVVLNALAFEHADMGDGRASSFSSVPLDDTWIHYVYAESFATSLRLDYNPGQSESGFTSLLWVLLIAPWLALHIPAPLASKLLGLAAQAGLAFVLYHWLNRRGPGAAAAIAGLLIAVEPIFSFAALSGMEVMLYALGLVTAVVLFLRSRYRLAAVALAAVVATRPDGLMLATLIWLCAAVDRLVGEGRRQRTPIIEMLPLVILPVAVAATWTLYCRVATDLWLPMSYYVRAEGVSLLSNLHLLQRIWGEISDSLISMSHPWKVLPLLAGVAGALVEYRWRGLLLVLFPALFVLVLGGEIFNMVGGTFVGNRYIVPAFPFLLALQVLGVGLAGTIVRRLMRGHPWTGPVATVVILVLLLALLLPVGEWVARHRQSRDVFARSCANIDDMQVAIGQWVDRTTPPEAVIAVHDAGAIRYVGRRKTLDINGLNAASYEGESTITPGAVDYLITFPQDTAEARLYEDSEVFRVVLEDNVICAHDTMVVYRVE